MTLQADVPDPGCLGVSGEQRIEIANRIAHPVSLDLDRFRETLPPGAKAVFDAPVKDYLARRLHFSTEAYASGRRLEVWYRPDGWSEG